DKKYTLGFYPIRGLDSYLNKKETTIFDGTAPITTKEEYLYNEYLQLKEHRLTNSDGSILYNYQVHGVDRQGSNTNLGQISNIKEKKTIKNGKVINWEVYNYNPPGLQTYPMNVIIGIND